jgi:uncharacterized protein YdeI (YjbR/CyaY-like superfamily)
MSRAPAPRRMRDRRPVLTLADRETLHIWLGLHHTAADGVWAGTYDRPDPRHLPWRQILAEALCWGWTEGGIRRLPGARSAILLVPQAPAVVWTPEVRALVSENRAAGRMQPPGEAAVATARAAGLWDAIPQASNLDIPADLAAALGRHRLRWEGWSPSIRRAALGWIRDARNPRHRAARIAATVAAAARSLPTSTRVIPNPFSYRTPAAILMQLAAPRGHGTSPLGDFHDE